MHKFPYHTTAKKLKKIYSKSLESLTYTEFNYTYIQQVQEINTNLQHYMNELAPRALWFFKVTPLESSSTFYYFNCLFFDCKYRLYLPLFALNVMSFPACTCEPVGTQHYFEFPFRGVGFRCVGLAQRISARCKSASNTGSNVFSQIFICIFILFLAWSYMYFSPFPQRVYQIWK